MRKNKETDDRQTKMMRIRQTNKLTERRTDRERDYYTYNGTTTIK